MIVCGILDKWDCIYEKGILLKNYIGDIFGSLGGYLDFGFGSFINGERVKFMVSDGGSEGGDEYVKMMWLKRVWCWRGVCMFGMI